MFKSIYKKLKEDFDFLNNYGFIYRYDAKHFEVPSILYAKNELKIEVGFNYREDRFYINITKNNNYRNMINLLDGVALPGKTYKEQVNIAKEYLRRYIEGANKDD